MGTRAKAKMWGAQTRATLLVALSLLPTLHAARMVGFEGTVTGIAHFQHKESGGFQRSVSISVLPALDATADALFLGSLFGVSRRFDIKAAANFVQRCANSDHGAGRFPGVESDIDSVRDSVLANKVLTELGVQASDRDAADKTAAFLTTLVDTRTGLFGDRVGAPGDIRSTAIALELLETIGLLQAPHNRALFPGIRNALMSCNSSGSHFELPTRALPAAAANYYAIAAAVRSGFFDGVGPDVLRRWVDFITNLQGHTGGFFGSLTQQEVSTEASVQTVLSLQLLSRVFPGAAPAAAVTDRPGLLQYLKRETRYDMHDAAQAHQAVLAVGGTQEIFEMSAQYSDSVASSKVVVQGEPMWPELSVLAFGSLPQPQYEVTLSVRRGSEQVQRVSMRWDKPTERYIVNSPIETAGSISTLRLDYLAKHVSGTTTLRHRDTVTVRLGLAVEWRAVSNGRQLTDDESLIAGTELFFSVQLHNSSHKALANSDPIKLDVRDASGVIVDSPVVPRKQQDVYGANADSSDPVQFEYKIAQSSTPPGGPLWFLFSAHSEGNEIAHTEHQFHLAALTVSSQVELQKPQHIEESLKVSMLPGNMAPDHTAVEPLAGGGLLRRQFTLHVFPGSLRASALNTSTSILTVDGTPSGTDGRYSFEAQLPGTLDVLGPLQLRFGHMTSGGGLPALLKHHGDPSELIFKVQSQVAIARMSESPSATEFFFGNAVHFRFQLKDVLSGRQISGGALGQATIVLEHMVLDAEGRWSTVTSLLAEPEPESRQQGQHDAGWFHITWTIDPNTVRGPGMLALLMKDARGATSKITQLDARRQLRPYEEPINVGGQLDVDWDFWSSAGRDSPREALFTVKWILRCNSRQLQGARVRATVQLEQSSDGALVDVSSQLNLVPVVSSGSEYQFSWTSPYELAATGKFRVSLYRERDLENGNSWSASEPTPDAEPFYVMDIEEQNKPPMYVPLSIEFLAVLALGYVYFNAQQQQRNIGSKRK